MTIKDKVQQILERYPSCRECDIETMFRFWQQEGAITGTLISLDQMKRATPPETIRRSRQKVQEEVPELRARGEVARARKQKEKTRGKFINKSRYTGLKIY